MNDVLETIKTRRSVRKYKTDAVPDELLDKIAEAGLYAASGLNRQSAIILKITNKTCRDRISALNAAVMGREGSDPFYGAPAVLVVLADKSFPTYLYDGSLAMGNMMLEAHALGLGSCWIHRAKEVFAGEEGKKLLKSLGIDPEKYEGIGNLIVGYTDGEYPAAAPRNEKRFFEIV